MQNWKRFFIVPGLLLVVVMLALAACGGAATPAPTAPTPAPAEPTKAPAEPAATQPPAVTAPTTLRVTFAWPTFIDPAVGNDYSSSSAMLNLYDSLVFPNKDGGVDPWLAESWETSADGLTWTFKLRQGVKFHDGSALTASDVVYSMQRLQNIGESFAYMFDNVTGVSASDDQTVAFTLSQPSGLFLLSLVRLYVLNENLVRSNTATEGSYGDNGDYGKNWLLTHDAGSGPYTVKEFPLEEYLLMEKNKAWWGNFAANAPDEVRFIATTETATVRTLMSDRRLEISDQWQTVAGLKALDGIAGIGIAAIPTMSEFYFMMNTKIAPTDDIHCRRAMSYAFDYDTAVGLEWSGTQQSQGPVPITLAGHDPNVFVFSHDLDKAKAELAQCQYANELDQYPVEIHWISEVPDEEKFALLFQANMADIGVSVKVVSTPWLSVVENMSKQETSPHVVTIYVSADLPDAGVMLNQRYSSVTADQWLQNEWLLDKDFDAKIADALATVDQDERYAKYYELQNTIVGLAPSLFIYDQVEKHAVQEYVDWPAARGESSPMMGYYFFAPQIGVNPAQ
ncbi:MAG: ABC transporter substrate-binding protein [Chloroflexi bacterium]|nr:ABC transporter substrate-binding protein [Chloroflexota bacterium]